MSVVSGFSRTSPRFNPDAQKTHILALWIDIRRAEAVGGGDAQRSHRTTPIRRQAQDTFGARLEWECFLPRRAVERHPVCSRAVSHEQLEGRLRVGRDCEFGVRA